MFKRRYFPPLYRTTLRWRLLGWVIIVASMALAAYVKVQWVKHTEAQLLPGRTQFNAVEILDEGDRLNRALGDTIPPTH